MVVDLQHGRQPTASISDTNSTAASPTGCHWWCVPRCTTASPGPSTTGSVPAAPARVGPTPRCRRRWWRWCATPPLRGRAPPGGAPSGRRRPRREARAPSRRRGRRPAPVMPAAPPDCQSSTSATPSSAPGESAHGGEPSVERVRRAVLAGGGHEPPGRPSPAALAAASAHGRNPALPRGRGGPCTRRTCRVRRPPPATGAGCRAARRRRPAPSSCSPSSRPSTMRPSSTTMKSRVSVACMPGRSGSSPSTRIQSPPPGEADEPHRAAAAAAAPAASGPSGTSPPSSTVAGVPSSHNQCASPKPSASIVPGGDHRSGSRPARPHHDR